jgi:hypothetical protein
LFLHLKIISNFINFDLDEDYLNKNKFYLLTQNKQFCHTISTYLFKKLIIITESNKKIKKYKKEEKNLKRMHLKNQFPR